MMCRLQHIAVPSHEHKSSLEHLHDRPVGEIRSMGCAHAIAIGERVAFRRHGSPREEVRASSRSFPRPWDRSIVRASMLHDSVVREAARESHQDLLLGKGLSCARNERT